MSKLTVARCSLPLLVALLAGCDSHQAAHDKLNSAETSLSAHQYDSAIRDADAARQSAGASDQAEADYLRGLAIEQRPKSDPNASIEDLELARQAYVRALSEHPIPPLKSRILGQLGNVAYFQDDYPTALSCFTGAYSITTHDDWKPLLLYRMGVCQQRLGRFADADRTFANLIVRYPGTQAARHAHQRVGVRAFYVQVGAFSNPADAQKAAEALRISNLQPMETKQNGLVVIRTGSIATYASALQVKGRLLARFPDARIMP